MPELVRVKGGVTYTCRPNEKGVYYIHWTEGRRSKRTSTHQREASLADEAFDEWLKYQGVAQPDENRLTCADIWDAIYGEKYIFHWNNLKAHFGPMLLQHVNDDTEAEYLRLRKSGKIGRADPAPSTLRTELALLRASWSHASKPPHKLVHPSIVPAMPPLPPASEPRTRWLRPEEMKHLFETAESLEYLRETYKKGRMSRVLRFLWIAREACARRNAIETLTWAQVDFQTRVIHFNPEGRKQTSKRRPSVPMSSALFEFMQKAYAERVSDYVLDNPGSVGTTLKDVTRAAGFEDVSAHTIRHTAATYMAKEGVPLWIVAQLLGNSVKQVEEVYAKYQPDFGRAHIDAISNALQVGA